ncbi:hypothetical protein NL676_019792 [Syzygium grande]|nr:hypothetical protein NL676_019792 [Syzygium grande]
MHMGVSRCFPWLSRVSNGKKPDGFGTLPDDAVVDVLGRLEVDQLGHAKRVCRRWRALIGTAHFTRVHLQRASSVTVMYSFFLRWRCDKVSLFFLDWGLCEEETDWRSKVTGFAAHSHP